MQSNWNKRKFLHKEKVQLPQDWFGTPTWPPFHCFGWLFLEWILQNTAGHLMMFAQRSILNRDSTDVDKNKAELHLSSEHPFWGFSTDLHYLGLSTDLKTVSCHL